MRDDLNQSIYGAPKNSHRSQANKQWEFSAYIIYERPSALRLMAWLRLSRHGREHTESASATQSADNPSLFRVSVPLCAFAISQAATLTLISPDLWLLFLLGQRQKFFVCDFAVLHLVDSHLRHLRSFLRRFLGHIHIELHYERISGYKRPAHFRALPCHIFVPSLSVTS